MLHTVLDTTFAVACLLATAASYSSVWTELPPDAPYRLRPLAYKDCAEYLAARVRPDERVAAAEVGALGYWYSGSLLDGCGLVSPETLPYLPVPPGAVLGAMPAGLIKDQRPDWIVTLPYFMRGTLSKAEWFPAEYDLVQQVPLRKPVFGDTSVAVYRRRG